MDEVYNFLNELIDEFGAEGTISHDTFNKAVNLRSNIIADSEPCDGENGVLPHVSGMLPDCKHEHIESSDGCDECLDCGARNF